MLGSTSVTRRTRKGGVQRLTRTATRPSTKGTTGNQSLFDESLDWLDRKLQQIDQKLSQIRTYISEESNLEPSN